MLARFDIVLVAFAFTDGLNIMPRPAMVIYLSEPHIRIICLLSSAQRLQGQPNSDELTIRADHPQFHQSGLKVSSRCRLSRLTTLALPLVRRRIGRLPEDLRPAG